MDIIYTNVPAEYCRKRRNNNPTKTTSHNPQKNVKETKNIRIKIINIQKGISVFDKNPDIHEKYE